DRLRRCDAPRLRELHGRAASYHYDWLNGYEERRGKKTYAAWYRYEDPVWQAHERAWLYHEAQLANALPDGPERDEQRLVARRRFVRILVDALWWWGCYLDLPFTHELIEDWTHTQEDGDGWLAELGTVLSRYPTGYDKTRPEEDRKSTRLN